MTGTLHVLINELSGRAGGEGCDRVKEDLRRAVPRGMSIDFTVAHVPDLMEVAKDLDTDAIATAGGDGTIAAIGSVLANRKDAPVFIPLPYGTANLIPRDLLMPMEPSDALHASLKAPYRYIDFVQAGKQGLLHSAAFGNFAEMAEDRESFRKAPTFGDALGAAAAMWEDFVETRDDPYRITIDGEAMEIDSSAVFVTNNPITHGVGGVPRREALDGGRMIVYISRSGGVFGLLQHVIEAMRGDFDDSEDFFRFAANQVTVETLGRELHYTIDGEPSRDKAAITFQMKPSSLKVPDLRDRVPS
jgi:diacylglycerol kinase family enzyme